MERRTTRLGSNKMRLSDAPSRDLWLRDRASGDLAALRHYGFPPLPVPVQPTSVAEPLNGPGRQPLKASESALARHSRGRRIRPAWVTPPRPSFRSVPLEAPLTGQDGSTISEVWGTEIGIHSQARDRAACRLFGLAEMLD